MVLKNRKVEVIRKALEGLAPTGEGELKIIACEVSRSQRANGQEAAAEQTSFAIRSDVEAFVTLEIPIVQNTVRPVYLYIGTQTEIERQTYSNIIRTEL